MSVILYAVESAIMSLLGWVWLICRTMSGARSFIEEYILYSHVILSVLHLAHSSMITEKQNECRAYFTIILALWCLGLFAVLESIEFFHYLPSTPMDIYTTTTSIVNITRNNTKVLQNQTTIISCCPNNQPDKWNQHLFFGGFTFFWGPMAVTLAFQTIHLFIAGGALLNTQKSLWTGPDLSYSMLTIMAFNLCVKFTDHATNPCPTTIVTMLSTLVTLSTQAVFILFLFTFPMMAAIETLVTTPKFNAIWKLINTACTFFFYIVIYLYLSDTHIITPSFITLGVLSLFLIVCNYVHLVVPSMPAQESTTSLNIQPKQKYKAKWVMPMQTDHIYDPSPSSIINIQRNKSAKKD